MPTRVWQVSCNFIDATQQKHQSLYCIEAANDVAADALAAACAMTLQLASECKGLEQMICFDGQLMIVKPHDAGDFKKQAIIYCESAVDPIQDRRYMYKIRLISPEVLLLTDDGTALDLTKPATQSFVQNFLAHTCDWRGNPFYRVIKAPVIKYSGGV